MREVMVLHSFIHTISHLYLMMYAATFRFINFYRAVMPQNVVCPSVSPSVCPSVFMYHDLIGWNTLKIISRLMR